MKIPNILKVEGHEIAIVYLDGDDKLEVEGKLVNGLIDKQYCKMVLNKNATRSITEETFFHEVLHLCDDNEVPLSEQRIDSMARRLYAILKNNDMLIERDDSEIEEEKRKEQEQQQQEEQQENSDT